MAEANPSQSEVRFEWLIEKRILFIDVSVEATDKMPLYDQTIVDYLDSASGEVDIILRLPRPKQAPPSLKRLTSYKYQQHPQLGYMVMIGLNLNPMIRFFITSASRIANMKMRTFETLDEAMRFLRAVRDISA